MKTVAIPLLLVALLPNAAYSLCPEPDQIHCGNNTRCTRIRYICDGDNDCGDNIDESPSLCNVWRNSDCDRNMARCNRLGESNCITVSNYCTMSDPPCEGTLDMRLCVMLKIGRIQPLEFLELPTTTPSTTVPTTTPLPIHVIEEKLSNEFEKKLTRTMSHKDCPQLYTRVGNQCLSIFFVGNMTWIESRALCQAIGGDLFKVGENIEEFTTILQHLKDNAITVDFWVGGRYVNESLGWQWIDDTSVKMGSPYWAVRCKDECSFRPLNSIPEPETASVCYHYEQAPSNPSAMRQCIASNYQYYYYLSDEHCFNKKSPLCVMPMERKQQAQ